MKVLIADDEAVTRRLLAAALTKWGYDVAVVENGDEAWSTLQKSDAPRLAILDWVMPGISGVDLCRKIRERSDEAYTYILLLTGRNTKQDIIDGLDSGADDYITKPFDTQELRVRLRTGQRLLDLMEQLVAARESLRIQATSDSLTGLLNRAAIIESLERELFRAERETIPLTLLLADVDHFKQINDTHGHQVGDAVLRAVAQSFRDATRPYDAIGRYGGEEFLIVVPGCTADCAAGQADRLRACVSHQPVITSAGPVRVTVSIGAAVFANDRPTDAQRLIRIADAALYRAKNNGRNCIEVGTSVGISHDDWAAFRLSTRLPLHAPAPNCTERAAG